MTKQEVGRQIKVVEERLQGLMERMSQPAADREALIATARQELSTSLKEFDALQQGLERQKEEILSDQVGVERQLKHTLAEMRRRESETRWLLEAARAVLESHRFERSARRIFDAAREVTGAVSGYVALLSEDGAENEVLFLESGGLPCDVNPELPMPIRGLRAEAYTRAAAVYENDFENSEWVQFMPSGHVEMRNVLFAPLTIDEQVVGVIGLANKPGDFTSDDARIAKAFGDLAAIALSRVWAEEALRESERRHRLITQVTNDVIWEWDLASQKLSWSEGFTSQFGYQPGSATPTIDGWTGRIHPQDRDRVLSDFYAVVEGSATEWRDEYRYRRADGSYATVVDRGILLFDDERPVRMIGGMTDISERKMVEQALRESDERYQTILSTIEDGYFEIDLAGNFTFFNDAMARILGYPKDQMVGMNYQAYMGQSVADHVYRTFNQVYRTGEANRGFDWKLTRKDGSECWVSVSVVLILDNEGQPVGFRGIARDVTARKRAEQALQASEEKYRGLVERSLQGMVIAQDNPVRVSFASRPMERITGFTPEELTSFSPQQLAGLIHPQHREAFFQNFRGRVRGEELSPRRDYRIIHKSGEPRWVEIYSSRIEYEGEPATQTVFLDITARKAAEAKLQEYAHLLEEMVDSKVRELEQERAKIIQMDKMAALGQLATGVAHELNQPLTSITFEADFLRKIAQQVAAEECALEEILSVSELDQIGTELLDDLARCRRIIDHMREFSRLSQGCPRCTNINQVVENSFIFVRARLRNREIDAQLNLSPDLPFILVDPHRLEQVFLNLIANAEYALEQRATREDSPGYRKRLEIGTACQDGWVVATVQDNGPGIPEDVQKRIFDPFFTTKPVGEGTGLGLSISYGIVTEYGGEITCDSAEGEGTRFTLRFPVSEERHRGFPEQ